MPESELVYVECPHCGCMVPLSLPHSDGEKIVECWGSDDKKVKNCRCKFVVFWKLEFVTTVGRIDCTKEVDV